MRKNYFIVLIIFFILPGCGLNTVKKTKHPAPEPFDIAITGDIMAARRLAPVAEKEGFDYLFEKVKSELLSCSLVFGNLETTLIEEEKLPGIKKNGDKSYYFYSSPKTAGALKNAGFTLVSLGNNHSVDYGQKGVISTLNALYKCGVDYCGLRKGELSRPNDPVIKTVNNTKVGFLCYSNVSHEKFAAGPEKFGTIPGIKSVIGWDIKEAKKKADLVVVYMHWGKEGKEVQKSRYKLGRFIIDEGADIVVGSHTHVFQDVEIYKGKYIFYGLGNFVFDMRAEKYRKSAILKIKIDNKKIQRVKLVPVRLENYRPRVIRDRGEIFEFLSGIRLINARLKDIY